MKIIKGVEFSESPHPWWVDRLIKCEFCQVRLLLEAKDPVEVLEDAKTPEHDMVQFNCPTCEQRVMHFRNSPQEKQLAEAKPVVAASDPQPEAVEKLEMPPRKSYEYRSHDLGVETLILDLPVQSATTEQTWGDAAQSLRPGFSWKWPLISAVTIFSGIVMMMVLPKWLSPTPPKMKTTVLTVEDPRTEYEINLAASKEMELLTTALKGYFSAKTIEEMCQYVRLPERVRPMMATYYAKKPLVPNPIAGKLPALEPLPSPEGRNFWVAKCALKDGQIKNIVVETRSNGEVKVDWENATGYQIMGFDEFADQQPRELPLDFRVNIKYGSYYADEFSDEEIWRCFMLSAPNATSIIYGYIKRDNPLLGELEDLIRRNGGTSRLGILQLKFPREFQAKRAALIEKSSAPSGSI